MLDALFVSGTVAAAMQDSESPGTVLVMRQQADAWNIEVRAGNLLAGTQRGSERAELIRLRRAP